MGKREGSFDEWVTSHQYKNQIESFLLWTTDFEEMESGKSVNRKRKNEIEESIIFLDDLSVMMKTEKIIEYSIYRPNQFFNADKFMRVAKKNALISRVLFDIDMKDRPHIEENMWYVMRLYSIFLDFHKLEGEEYDFFKDTLTEIKLPTTIVKKQYIGWGILTFFLSVLIVIGIVLLAKVSTPTMAIATSVFLILGMIFFVLQGVRNSLPFQFKKAIENAELYCIRGQVSDIGEDTPFTSISWKTQTLHVSSLHDSLGKIFTFYALQPLSAKTDGTPCQIIFIRGMNIAIDTFPLLSKSDEKQGNDF